MHYIHLNLQELPLPGATAERARFRSGADPQLAGPANKDEQYSKVQKQFLQVPDSDRRSQSRLGHPIGAVGSQLRRAKEPKGLRAQSR